MGVLIGSAYDRPHASTPRVYYRPIIISFEETDMRHRQTYYNTSKR